MQTAPGAVVVDADFVGNLPEQSRAQTQSRVRTAAAAVAPQTAATDRHRTLALWFPDWPAVAALRHARLPLTTPAVLLSAGRIEVTTAAARKWGIRRGMRRRDAVSRCPELTVLPTDPDRDARFFEPIVAEIEEVVPGVEVLRPGLIVCGLYGPSRYFGSEDAAAQHLIDTADMDGAECLVGVAGSLPVAVLAARQQIVIPPGESDAQFCARLPLPELARDPAIADPSWPDLIEVLQRLGMRTAGDFAELPLGQVAARFGAAGVGLHRLASGLPDRDLARRNIEADLVVDQQCDPPLQRVDTAAFVSRSLAERFHHLLASKGLACTRLAITAVTSSGEHLTRVWRCVRPLSAADTADRMRWQLDGWLTSRNIQAGKGRSGGGSKASALDGFDDHVDRGLVSLHLEAIETIESGQIQYGLWGTEGDGPYRAEAAFARVQGLLGADAVKVAAPAGGRRPADRVTIAAWGEANTPPRDPDGPWPGAIPAPHPARIPGRTAKPVAVVDQQCAPVAVTDRGLLVSPPATVAGRAVVGWAGPWLINERWWSTARDRTAWMQVLIHDGPPLLLGYLAEDAGAGQWFVEAVYD